MSDDDGDDWFDPDIRALDLDFGEKSGLQLYRNYTRAFENEALKRFRATLDGEVLDLERLRRVVSLVCNEDLRFIPVIACGFADDLLREALNKAITDGVPGGSRDLFTGFGPLSDLAKRIKMAYAFDVLSHDLLEGIDAVRTIRNRIAHDWDLEKATALFAEDRLRSMYAIEKDLQSRGRLRPDLPVETWFRVRVIWMLGRLEYEAATFHRAKSARVSPRRALYDDGGTDWLGDVSQLCLDATDVLSGRMGD